MASVFVTEIRKLPYKTALHQVFADTDAMRVLRETSALPDTSEVKQYVVWNLARLRTTSGMRLGRSIEGLPDLFRLPVVVRSVELSQGSGNTAEVWRVHSAKHPSGKALVAKISLRQLGDLSSERELAEQHAADVDSLMMYGGPRSEGLARLQDDEGRWRWAAVMREVEGVDLSKLREARTLPFPITQAHVKSMENFIERIKADGGELGDVQQGDFILTPEGKVVPLDMSVGHRFDELGTLTPRNEEELQKHLTSIRELAAREH